jgi:uncharacterized phage protein (TIGR02218 family)
MTASTVTQGGAEYLFRIAAGANVEQAGVEYLLRVQPQNGVQQAGVEYLYKAVPCATQWCQIFTITRTDGEVFRYTTLDRDLDWKGDTYSACNSVVPSASESTGDIGAVGSMELTGLISDDGIAEFDLYAGLYDGARVEAWLVPWAGSDAPHRLLLATVGQIEFGADGWKVELIGDGAKLQQTPLLQTYTPQCRWKFGDANCTVDLAPLSVTGTADAGSQRSFTDAARSETAGYFSFGRVTFTSGANDGISAEIREHAAGGVFTLWPRLASDVAAGDTYSMTPGCLLSKTGAGGTNGCVEWSNYDNYGGFPDVPGEDAILARPVAKQG